MHSHVTAATALATPTPGPENWTGATPHTRPPFDTFHPSILDTAMLTEALSAGQDLPFEHFHEDRYLDDLIPKPWGHEYRIYADQFYDIWKLSISAGQSTSLHCHPRKDTALLCLSGSARIRLLDQTHSVSEGDLVQIKKGVFHQTTNTGSNTLDLVEIETPRNKLDLVRTNDQYGRRGAKYEQVNAGTSTRLRHIRSIPFAKARAKSLDGVYRFRVRANKRVSDVKHSRLLFAVSLGLNFALAHDIHVLNAAVIRDENGQNYGTYFTIERERTEVAIRRVF